MGKELTKTIPPNNNIEKWVESTSISIAERVGVSFGVGCRCAKERLEMINANSAARAEIEARMGTNEDVEERGHGDEDGHMHGTRLDYIE